MVVLARIERIVSVSSEDQDHPAQNLIAGSLRSTNVKWRCKTPGERQITVVFQLTQSQRINVIEVKNENSAFLEVLVGRSCMPDLFKTILVSSSLMTVREAKLGENPNKVRVFQKEDLCSDVASEKWDRVKVSCSQPFNSTVTFGLCSIDFHVEPCDETHELLTLSDTNSCLSKLITSNEPDFPGILRKNECHASRLSGAAAARSATNSLGCIKLPSASRFKAIVEDDRSSALTVPNDNHNVSVISSYSMEPQSDTSSKVTKDCLLVSSSNTEPSQTQTKKIMASSTSLPTDSKKKLYKPFRRLLEGVVFTISGYQNPLRSNLRKKATEMGAKYRADWDDSCTHLICAFMNTPKYQEVRGRGKIVTKHWIEECYSKRKVLLWRRFALATIDKARPDSDEEIFEEEAPLTDHRKTLFDSESDSTDEEFREIKKRKKSDRQRESSSDHLFG